MHAGGGALAGWLPGHHVGLGGGGLAHFLVRLFIWRAIGRFFRLLWHIPAVGPVIVIVLILAVAGFILWRMSRGRSAGVGGGPRGGGPNGRSPRDW